MMRSILRIDLLGFGVLGSLFRVSTGTTMPTTAPGGTPAERACRHEHRNPPPSTPSGFGLRVTDAHHGAGRHAEGGVLHQQPVAVRLGEARHIDDHVAQARPHRDRDRVQVLLPRELGRLRRAGGTRAQGQGLGHSACGPRRRRRTRQAMLASHYTCGTWRITHVLISFAASPPALSCF